MKVCVLMVGAARPSAERVIENIRNNITFFTSNYPNYTFDFVVCTYKNKNFTEILNFCEMNRIIVHPLEPINDSDIPKRLDDFVFSSSPDFTSKNRYRLFYSMNHVLSKISYQYDCIIRLRIDTEIKTFELVDKIQPSTYYTVIDTIASCSDNIGYANLDVMKRVWELDNCFVKANNAEILVFKAVKKNSFRISQFKFRYIMYQDDSEYFDGVKQWSRRTREWAYDGKTYVRGEGVGV